MGLERGKRPSSRVSLRPKFNLRIIYEFVFLLNSIKKLELLYNSILPSFILSHKKERNKGKKKKKKLGVQFSFVVFFFIVNYDWDGKGRSLILR